MRGNGGFGRCGFAGSLRLLQLVFLEQRKLEGGNLVGASQGAILGLSLAEQLARAFGPLGAHGYPLVADGGEAERDC